MKTALKAKTPLARRSQADRMRPVRRWLYLIAALVALMVLLGGTTRLTGAGLSITEWKPVTGMSPPFSEADWQAEFERYKSIPQYQQVNQGMSLGEFKFIYWWEWSHRTLGRVLAIVFLVPFAGFMSRGLVDRALGWKLGGLFALGGLQGAIGWWMVASGLSERTDVSQYRLAVHLTLACFILATIVAIATSLKPRRKEKALPARARYGAISILMLVFVQIFLGALVAKTNAGLTFNTWPLIDGNFIPPLTSLFAMNPSWKNLFENVLTVQFDHRMIAYALFVLAAWHAFDAERNVRPAALGASMLFALVTAQAMLGVLTLLWAVPFVLALAHQFGAVAVLVAASVHGQRLSSAQRGATGKSL
ncbi:MAG TPA: COX15/CtaA family protein [Xanthobacteraceae bacterium]|nr:COX15/CtaA family protein [Xanthobacteraceae bacterium]